MFLTRHSLSRRTVLRGLGVSISLPLLDSMIPAQTPLRQTAAAAPTRLSCIEMVHGAAGSTQEGDQRHYWSPARAGSDLEMSFSLEPLQPLRDYITVVSGTDARPAEAYVPSEGGADHFRSSAVFLTAAHPKQTAGPDVYNGVSIDQLYSRRAAADTRLASIQLCIDNIGLSGSCGFNYNCVYLETISWASATEPLAMTVNPRLAFETLFGTSPQNRSVLDAAADDAVNLKARLGPGDRRRVEQQLEEIRGIEKRIEEIEKHNATVLNRALPSAPLGVPDSWEQHVKLMFDLQRLSFASDITRVSAFKMSRDTSNRIFAESGVKAPFHTLSHHGESPEKIADFAKINRYHVSVVADFLRQLRDTPDGDGNLLDHSLILYGSPMGNSNAHNHRNLPVFLAGHAGGPAGGPAGGNVKGNLHVVCADGTPHANTLLTILHKLGVDVESVGDSTGEIAI